MRAHRINEFAGRSRAVQIAKAKVVPEGEEPQELQRARFF
jgi:hypothetical protein